MSTPAAEDSGTPATTNNNNKDGPSAVEFEPPLACVRRILKNSLPHSTNVGKDASAAFARACGIFIIYLTACANDFAREHKRQTITANDVLAAVKELDFEEFTPDMLSFLATYRATEKSKKDAKAASKKVDTAASENPNNTAADGAPGGGEGDLDEDDEIGAKDDEEHDEENQDSRKRPPLDDDDDEEDEDSPVQERDSKRARLDDPPEA